MNLKRKGVKPNKKLKNLEIFEVVKKLFLEKQWSPEQIAARLKLENMQEQRLKKILKVTEAKVAIQKVM